LSASYAQIRRDGLLAMRILSLKLRDESRWVLLTAASVFAIAALASGCRQPQAVLDQRLLDACGKSDLAEVKAALAAGANPNAVDSNPDRGFTALELGVETPEIVKELLRAGASPTKADMGGFHPISMAAAAGKTESLRLILDAGAPLETHDSSGSTALASAASAARVENAKLLLARGAKINAEDKYGFTPLFHCVMGPMVKSSDKVAMLRLLLEHKADVRHKDKKGKIAADYAGTKLFRGLDKSGQVLELLNQAAKGQKIDASHQDRPLR